jgi:hypothetical protein
MRLNFIRSKVILSGDQNSGFKVFFRLSIMRSKVFKFIKLDLWLIFSPNYKTPVHKNFQSHDQS